MKNSININKIDIYIRRSVNNRQKSASQSYIINRFSKPYRQRSSLSINHKLRYFIYNEEGYKV